MEIASADKKSAEAMTDFLRGCTNQMVALNFILALIEVRS
jgi:hypothetical protein